MDGAPSSRYRKGGRLVVKVNWHKSAAKDVRPFFGTATLESSLESAQIRLYDDASFSTETAFIVEPQDAEKLCVSIRPNLNAALASDSIKKSDLRLAVTAAQAFMKKTCVVVNLPVSGELPEEIAIGDEVLSQLGGGSNINVEIALCLGKRMPKKPGSPFLFGHWLSKKRFSLNQPKLAEDFEVVPMDDDAWKRIGFPAKTLYWVEYFGGVNEPVAKDKQMAKVRVHADIYKKLTVESNQRLAKPIMATLAAEISCQVLAASFSEWEQADEEVAHSPLSAFLKRINRVQACSLDELKKLTRQAGMPKLRALLHADQQSVRSIAEA